MSNETIIELFAEEGEIVSPVESDCLEQSRPPKRTIVYDLSDSPTDIYDNTNNSRKRVKFSTNEYSSDTFASKHEPIELISDDFLTMAFETSTTTSIEQSKPNEPVMTEQENMITVPTNLMELFHSLISNLQFRFGVRLIMDEKTRNVEILGKDIDVISIAKHSILEMIHNPDSLRSQTEELKLNRLHVFVDESNIFLGARKCVHRKFDPNAKVDPMALASIAIHGRNCYQQVAFGSISSKSNSPVRQLWESIGFQVHIYERHNGGGEQFVDDALIASINNAILTYPSPPHPQHTLVLLTGDGNENHGRVNFKDTVGKALLNGWKVELWSWKASLSRGYYDLVEAYEGTELFRILFLDDYHEILFPSTSSLPPSLPPLPPPLPPKRVATTVTRAAPSTSSSSSSSSYRHNRQSTPRYQQGPLPPPPTLSSMPILPFSTTSTSLRSSAETTSASSASSSLSNEPIMSSEGKSHKDRTSSKMSTKMFRTKTKITLPP